MIRQTDLAIICPILPERLTQLRALLQQLAADISAGETTLFDRLIENHFSRWVILEEAIGVDGDHYKPQLLFASNIDGDQWDYLHGLFTVDRALILAIYGCCEGFPALSTQLSDDAQISAVLAYWRFHRVSSCGFFIGATGLSRQCIKREAALVTLLQTEIDKRVAQDQWRGRSAEYIRSELQHFVRMQSEWSWALLPERCGGWQEVVLYVGKASLLILLILLVLLPLWFPISLILMVWLLMVRQKERQDQVIDIQNWQAHYDHIARIAVDEDYVQQNPMTSITEIKSGWIRQVTLRSVLGVINGAAEYIFTRGKLGDIETIHFARWIIMDEGRRLLFLSNYDGSWERYLGDFIDRAADGLTAIWSNTKGFPRTRWLIKGGARYAQSFKAYARASQLTTQVWYTAYRRLSVANINNNRHIREGLRGEMVRADAEAWLKLF